MLSSLHALSHVILTKLHKAGIGPFQSWRNWGSKRVGGLANIIQKESGYGRDSAHQISMCCSTFPDFLALGLGPCNYCWPIEYERQWHVPLLGWGSWELACLLHFLSSVSVTLETLGDGLATGWIMVSQTELYCNMREKQILPIKPESSRSTCCAFRVNYLAQCIDGLNWKHPGSLVYLLSFNKTIQN